MTEVFSKASIPLRPTRGVSQEVAMAGTSTQTDTPPAHTQ